MGPVTEYIIHKVGWRVTPSEEMPTRASWKLRIETAKAEGSLCEHMLSEFQEMLYYFCFV